MFAKDLLHLLSTQLVNGVLIPELNLEKPFRYDTNSCSNIIINKNTNRIELYHRSNEEILPAIHIYHILKPYSSLRVWVPWSFSINTIRPITCFRKIGNNIFLGNEK